MPEGNEVAVSDTGSQSLTDSVASDVSEWQSKDPQSKLSAQVAKDLEGVELPGGEEIAGNAGTAAPGSPQKDEFEEEKASLAQVFKKREAVIKERESAKAEAEAIMSEARQAQAQAQALMRQAQEAAQWVALLKKDPAKALAAAGVDPEDFILSLADEDNPERKRYREYEDKIREFEQWKAQQEEAAREWHENQKKQQWESHKKAVLTKFEDLTSKAPHVKTALDDGFISKKALEEYGHDISNQVHSLTGRYPSLEEIVEYIDEQYGKAYSKRGTPKPAQVAPTPVPRAPVLKSVKTLSLDDASDRRAIDASRKDLVGDERREAAAQAVRAVLAKAAVRKE